MALKTSLSDYKTNSYARPHLCTLFKAVSFFCFLLPHHAVSFVCGVCLASPAQVVVDADEALVPKALNRALNNTALDSLNLELVLNVTKFLYG